MKNLYKSLLLVLPVLLLIMQACSKEEAEPESNNNGNEPWKYTVETGNFKVNEFDVLIHEDVSSMSLSSNYLNQKDLPAGNYSAFSMNVYVPHSDPYISGLFVNYVEVYLVDGYKTGNIVSDVNFIDYRELNGIQYTMFKVEGIYNGSKSIDLYSFNEIIIDCEVYYKDAGGEEIYRREVQADAFVSGTSVGGANGDGGGSNAGGGSENNGAGEITFWVDRDFGCGTISVDLEGEGREIISDYYDSYMPECGSAGNANFQNLDPGTYSYSASCGDYSWSGTVNVPANQCVGFQLKLDDNGGGGGDGSSGGSGSGTGDVTFYLTEDVGCGNIYVELAGNGSKTISNYYTSNPGCGATGNANFYNLKYGTYEYRGTSDGGCTWNGNITIDQGCQTVRLTL